MLRLHGIVGRSSDPQFRGPLHRLEHSGCIELLYVPPEDAGRKRFRLSTDRGTDCAVSLGRGEELSDGALLFIDDHRAIVARFGEQRLWRLQPRDAAAALQLGWHAGNLHWRVRFEESRLIVLLDGPLETYRSRIRMLLDDGSVEDDAGV
ncbi:urease accessory protein UreE [Rhizobium sp. CC-YZS058]|uniref:urease accessory protein UreE n=1 Tax=Rhizobium sp. CC-YZS058 TaxID=3042153 RepID=UPI002B05EC25|nr:urease accessory protein UreE [Rhizobium sp. CC-YZS058]MEA3536659.1 urease accessory protein UreE [Rhizobium sp. CC-YZS058]